MKTTSRTVLLFTIVFALILAACPGRAQTVVWSENFDDGNADSRWFADQGVWQIGTPTVGPQTNSTGCRVHSCPNCATTGLTGNYLSGQESRLIRIASFIVPPANQSPRLRFWQWFSFAPPAGFPYNDDGSYGYVELKVGGGPWQQVSQRYINNSSGVWSWPSIDLTPFAGQSVQLAFHFHSTHNTDVGWYIDGVEVISGTPVYNNPEGFELGLGDWSVDAGTWQVGVPTSGPGSAHSGTNCVATVLAGNYASYVESRLISPAFVVPPAANFPRLRFWHWYSFAPPAGFPYNDNGSFGYVEIRVGTNGWQQISPTYLNGGSGVWTEPSIDLSPYGGQTNVQIAFHLHSTYNIAPGWYVDDVAVVTGALVITNPETFELGLGDWYAEAGTWQVGVPTSGPGLAHSGTNCAATVLAGNYASYVESRFISPPFVVPPAATTPALRFWHWYGFAPPAGFPYNDDGSYGYVELRIGTNAWQILSAQYSGQSGAWTQPYLDLRPYAGQQIQVAFHFHSTYNQASGWYVDDVRLVHDFVVLLLDSPIMRTQNVACISLGLAEASPAQSVSFLLQAAPGNLGNVTLNVGGCWSGGFTPQGDSQWLVTLQSGCPVAPMGVSDIGSVCFTAVSARSAFVPLTLLNLVVTNLDGSSPTSDAFSSRAVIIANESLLQANVATNGQRWLTLYGKADTSYAVQSASTMTAPATWTPVWTNTVPASLFYQWPLQGPLSNAPALFFQAHEN